MTQKETCDDKNKETIYPNFDKSLPIIGIDLGTKYSCAGVWKDGKVNIIPNEMGQYKNPLYIAFTDTDILFGDTAKSQISRNPKNTIFDITKLIGKKYEDPDIQENIKYWPFEIIKDSDSEYFKIKVTYNQQEKKYTPIEILTMLLEKIKKSASNFLGGQEIKNVIITIPVIPLYRSYICALKEACTACGLNVLSILNNTSAAAFAYGFNTINEKNGRNVLIFDLGSNNLEISLNYLEDGMVEVKRRYGYSCLGGNEFDKRLVEYCKERFRRKTGIEIGSNEKAWRRLFTYCEKAKRILSTTNQTTIEIECLMEEQDLILDMTRNKFEEVCYDLFKKYIPCIEKVLKDANVSKNEINEIILVGGSSRISKINQIIQDFFNGKIINKTLNPDECMAIGAVIKGEYIKNSDIIKDLIFLDKTNYSFGIETIRGVFTTIISRGATIPSKKTMLFTNNFDNDDKIFVQIFEGEKFLTKDNHLIGKIMVPISPMPKG
jgi:L1 cell adhesion molecule like protein